MYNISNMHIQKIFIAFFLFVLTTAVSAFGQSKNIIGKPVQIGRLQIAQFDFPEKMKIEEAAEACSALGKGWRLPTKTELNIIYINRAKIGGLSKGYYWSSSKSDYYNGSYHFINNWFQNFVNGIQYDGESDGYAFYVRAVRTI